MDKWRAPFTKGVSHFRAEKYREAIDCFSEALKIGGDDLAIYDSRAAAYQKLGKLKEALQDAKCVIDLQPDRWQGYARSARLFLQARKYDAASRMAELALERLPAEQLRRREELVTLQSEIESAREAMRKLASQRAYHFGKLPVEIAMNVFSIVLEQDHAFVVVLAQVCKNWRTAILNAPVFWGVLALGGHRPKRKVKLWRERARDRFRELAILKTFTDYLPVFDELRAVPLDSLRVFRLEGHRLDWLLVSMPMLLARIFATLDTFVMQLPSLQPLKLCSTDVRNFNWRVLRLTNVGVLDLPDAAKRSTRLESLFLEKCLYPHQWTEFLLLLHYNPTLVHLELSSFGSSFAENPLANEEDPPAAITLPNLISVRIENSDSVANKLLPRLVAPSLQSLHISVHPQRLDPCMTWLAGGPAATLTTLSIQRSPVKARLLSDVLIAAMALESLQLTHVCEVALPVIKLLATPIGVSIPHRAEFTPEEWSARRVHCPGLRHLDVSHCPDVTSSSLIALVRLRLPELEPGTRPAVLPVRPLESLVIDGCPDVDADVLPWLRSVVPSVSCIYMTRKNAMWR
ncbi:hypothetical protein BD414DRAFT_577234 [Trametes punicea]|nr:hypothetical protein BD414DRAFT_577234 [Trametes punicea]